MRILGISAYYHDSAAVLLTDGVITAAAQEERFTRRKHDPGFPTNAIQYCLEEGGISLSDVDLVAFYDKPFLKFERLLETYLTFAPRGFTSFAKALARMAPGIRWADRLLFSEHHESHAASAFYPSPFDEAVVLTMDGVGEWTTTSVAIGRGKNLEMTRELHFP